MTYAETGATALALGAQDNSVDGRRTSEALLRALNASGGLSGRRLVAVPFGWDTTSSSYAADASAACERFTRDERVEVVVDSVFRTTGGFADCLEKAGVLHLTSTTEGDLAASRARPLHANTQVMTDDRTYGAVLQRLAQVGYVTAQSRLGVVLEECPTLQAPYARIVVPLVRRLGLRDPVVRGTGCTSGFASTGAASSALSRAVLAFRAAGVDRVLLMSDFETVGLLLFANAASSQGYRPGYLLSSSAQAEATRPSLPADQWPQLRGVGTGQGGDVSLQGVAPTAVESRCLRLARAGGLQVVTQNDRTYVYLQCGLFLLLERALGATGGRSAPQGLAAAVRGLGTSFRAPGVVDGATRFGPARADGPDRVREFAYDAACRCLRHRGASVLAPA